jgi:hypothetical protein
MTTHAEVAALAQPILNQLRYRTARFSSCDIRRVLYGGVYYSYLPLKRLRL